MFPYFSTPLGNIYSYVVMISMGVAALCWILHRSLAFLPNREEEEAFIFPVVVISGLVGLFSSFLFDALFKIGENGGLAASGSTFYGGLIGACACLYLCLTKFGAKSTLSRREWFDLLTVPFICFHICGRIGCFLAGCCYGRETSSCLGVVFPDNPSAGIFHGGRPCFPTQLFEAAALVIILVLVSRRKNKFASYIVLYSILRFFIEFFRGDDRGTGLLMLSPAQTVSLFLLVLAIIWFAVGKRAHMQRTRRDGCNWRDMTSMQVVRDKEQ